MKKRYSPSSWRREFELDKLTDRSAVFNPSGIYALSWIYAIVGSVAGMRECLAQMREYSSVSEGLRIWEHFMEAEYDRLRGAPELAVPRYLGLLEAQAGRHMSWLWAAHGVLLSLESLGRFEEGAELGEQLLVRARAAQLNVLRGLILRPLALIQARLGNCERAVSHLSRISSNAGCTGWAASTWAWPTSSGRASQSVRRTGRLFSTTSSSAPSTTTRVA